MQQRRRHPATRLGVVWSLAASALSGGFFFLGGIVDASPEVVLAWQVAITTAFFAVGVILLDAALMGIQMWLFAWTPANDQAIEASSLGYLLLPIVLVAQRR